MRILFAEDSLSVAGYVTAVLRGQPMLPLGASSQVGASIGIALFPRYGVTATELLTAADSAMYEAKRDGKSRVAAAQDYT